MKTRSEQKKLMSGRTRSLAQDASVEQQSVMTILQTRMVIFSSAWSSGHDSREVERSMEWYMAIVNAVSFLIMGLDKQKARKGKWRIAERTIWLFAFAGGAIGAAIGMYGFHHKTRHRLFRYGLPLLAIFDMLIYVILYQ
ncbi:MULTISPECIES: DUF1294 domain-containing protein [Anoxybacillus]|jgi:uncharacterized membrane protein YsdA (DUF1294 family)|uniref:DUF1294 domain-containing protein n=1 Tax=Anoxybacillaceae TaxID=3120669 RepID=UPI001845FFD2|nr:DUF1294 domain-containing protein [Anoxybacillus rupiensis]MBB3907101.1 uncharacterized membrane protein YsdA (DUF1294 family) [Anoxybacillus rupiensis]